MFKPAAPPTMPTPDLVYAGSVATSRCSVGSLPKNKPVLTSDNSDLIFCVPMFVELWAADPVKVEHFKGIHGLVCPPIIVAKLHNSLTRKENSGMLGHL